MSFSLDTSKTKTRANENLSARVYSQIKHLIPSKPRLLRRAQLNGVSKGGEHPLWSRAGFKPRSRIHLILSNEIMPGQKLHHQQLSERLGVSRTLVREALTRLVQEGYVSFLPNRGFTCKEIRMQEAEELYKLRETPETFLASLGPSS